MTSAEKNPRQICCFVIRKPHRAVETWNNSHADKTPIELFRRFTEGKSADRLTKGNWRLVGSKTYVGTDCDEYSASLSAGTSATAYVAKNMPISPQCSTIMSIVTGAPDVRRYPLYVRIGTNNVPSITVETIKISKSRVPRNLLAGAPRLTPGLVLIPTLFIRQ
jgi:hypothetical protein